MPTETKPRPQSPSRQVDCILDRRLPYDLDAEQALLGSMLIGPDCCDDVVLRLRAEDFFDTANQTLYGQIVEMVQEGRALDVTLLVARLKQKNVFEIIGGSAYLYKISQAVPNAAHAVYYADLVADHARMRALIVAGTEIVRDGFDGILDAEQATTQAEQRIFALRDHQTASEPVHIREILHRCMDELDRRQNGEQIGRVVPTGFSPLDATLAGGLRAGHLVIMAGRPSMGKTACATDIARHAAGSCGELVLFVSLEMSAQELGDRILIAQSGVDGHRVRSGTLSNADKLKMIEAAGELASWNLHIEDNATLQVHQISSVARRLARKQKQPIGLVVVDYLQLIEENRGGRDSREQEVSRNSRAFKRLAKELNCPVVCVAQLNRKTDDAGNHRPKLSHLRESGAIEQDADVVMFVHREGYYLHGDEAREAEGKAEIIVAKNRNGPQADVEVRWDKRGMRFQDLAPERFSEFDDYNDDRAFR